jgi:hypothetical protein
MPPALYYAVVGDEPFKLALRDFGVGVRATS